MTTHVVLGREQRINERLSLHVGFPVKGNKKERKTNQCQSNKMSPGLPLHDRKGSRLSCLSASCPAPPNRTMHPLAGFSVNTAKIRLAAAIVSAVILTRRTCFQSSNANEPRRTAHPFFLPSLSPHLFWKWKLSQANREEEVPRRYQVTIGRSQDTGDSFSHSLFSCLAGVSLSGRPPQQMSQTRVPTIPSSLSSSFSCWHSWDWPSAKRGIEWWGERVLIGCNGRRGGRGQRRCSGHYLGSFQGWGPNCKPMARNNVAIGYRKVVFWFLWRPIKWFYLCRYCWHFCIMWWHNV